MTTIEKDLITNLHIYPGSWAEMIKESRRLEFALGNRTKRIEKNEQDPFTYKEEEFTLRKN